MIDGCQLGCEIAQGTHRVTFKYCPKGLRLGAAITGASWLGVLAFFAFRKIRKKKTDAGIA